MTRAILLKCRSLFRQIAVAVLSCVLLSAAVIAQDDVASKKVALLVGVNRYDKPVFSQLNFSERDVDELAKELRGLGFDVTVLKGSAEDSDRATRENIRAALQRLTRPLGAEDVMLVMFSGHGQQIEARRADGTVHSDAYYCPVDAVSNDPETMVSLSYVIDDVLAPNVGRKLLLVDACRDVPKDPSRGSKGIQGKVIALPEDTAVLFSCRAGQKSWENDELQHGLFTYCVLEGIRQQSGEEITWSNVVAHVDKRMASADMRARMGKPQEPIPAGGVPYTVLGRIVSLRPHPLAGKNAGDQRETGGEIAIKLRWCPPGTFLMGSPADEKERGQTFRGDEWFKEDQVSVNITRGFWIGQYELTQSEWEPVMGTTLLDEHRKSSLASLQNGGLNVGPRKPMGFVSYYAAREFCDKLTDLERAAGRLPEGCLYRLPTEAEWEYACRAGTTTAYSCGDTITDEQANIGTPVNGQPDFNRLVDVGSYAPNAWGIHDMHGNAGEWCLDWPAAALREEPDPIGPVPSLDDRKDYGMGLRGGSVGFSLAQHRSAYRYWSGAENRWRETGFRIVLAVNP